MCGSFREELNEAGVVCPEERSEEIIRLFTREDLQNHEKNTAASRELAWEEPRLLAGGRTR